MSNEKARLTLSTARLRLVAATPAMITAELDGRDRLAELLRAVIPRDWPPEHHDAETLQFWREQLSRPGAAGWWLYYVLLTASVPPVLVGAVGYKGPPTDGAVEVGYSVVPSWQRRGLATDATRALIEAAWERGADVAVAHTLEHLEPSLGVLRKLGFQQVASSEPGALEFVLRHGSSSRG